MVFKAITSAVNVMTGRISKSCADRSAKGEAPYSIIPGRTKSKLSSGHLKIAAELQHEAKIGEQACLTCRN